MKCIIAVLLAVASTASAHYTFPELTVKGQKTGLWTYVRKTTNYQSNGTSLMTCSTFAKRDLTCC
jgi:hypothetical protein